MPFRLTDFGLGFDEKARKQAMRQALVDAGLTIMSRAGSEGFGSLQHGLGTFVGGYRDSLHTMDRERDQEREDALREEIRKEQLEGSREDRLQRREERESSAASREQELAARREAIRGIADDKVRGELELRIAQPNFWEVLDKRTAPPKEPKAPEVRDFEDGTTRQWDPISGDWKVLARKPAKESDAGTFDPKDVISAADKAVVESRKKALERADKEIAEIR